MKYSEHLRHARKINLNKNFTLHEVIFSNAALKKDIYNSIDSRLLHNAVTLINKVLQPVRDHFNKPVDVSSFYRNEALNKILNGAKNSQHLEGKAADFTVKGVPIEQVIEYIRNNLEFDQVIHERTHAAEWIHVSFNNRGYNRKQVLKFDGSKYTEIK